MPPPDPGIDRRLLLVSIAASSVLGALGIVWGIVVGSQMILLDGVYAIVGIVLSGLLLYASMLATRRPSRRYPYGLQAATPLAIGVQGFVLLATLIYAIVEAGYTIRAGGSDVAAGWGMLYGAIVAVASVVVAVAISRQARTSDLLRAEAAGWRVAALRGVGMMIGFTVLALLEDSRWDGASPYVDPVMVVVSCVALVGTPIRMIRGTLNELLEGSPNAAVRESVEAVVNAVRAEFDLDPIDVYMTKIGPRLYVDVETTARPDVTIAEEHEVRRRLDEQLTSLPFDVWLNLELRPRQAGGRS